MRLTEVVKNLVPDGTAVRRTLTLSAVGVVLFFAYRGYEARHRRARLADLQLLEGVVESSLSDAWQVLGRSCKAVKERSACLDATPKFAVAPNIDRQLRGFEAVRLCRAAEGCGNFQEIRFAERVRELELERSFRELLILDAAGNVVASWRGPDGGLSRLEAGISGEPSDKKKDPKESAGADDGLLGLLRGPKDSVRANPSLIPVMLGGEELELAWTEVRMPCDLQPCSAGAAKYVLAGITSRPPPGFERHQVLIWHWFILGLILVLPMIAIVRVFRGYGIGSQPQERALLIAVLCGTLSVIALGVVVLAVAERQPMPDQAKERAKGLRDSIAASALGALQLESELFESIRTLTEIPPAPDGEGGDGRVAPCGFPDDVRAKIEAARVIAFLTNGVGDQLCLENSSNRLLVNRADRNYFALAANAGDGTLIGPAEIVNQQTGDRNWVFGGGVTPRTIPINADLDASRLQEAGDRIARFLFLAQPLDLCPRSETGVSCLIVDRTGRIVFSRPSAYALSGVGAFDLVDPGYVLERRLGPAAEFTEGARFRGERAIASAGGLDPVLAGALALQKEELYALAIVPLTPRFHTLQHALLSVAHWAFYVWIAPLLSLVLLSRFAPKGLLDVLLPQRKPQSRYAAGALTLSLFALFCLLFTILELDPRREILIAGLGAFGAPLLAFAILGAEPVGEGRLWRWLADPERVFRWYLPLFVLGMSAVMSWTAWSLGRTELVVLLGALAGPAALTPAAIFRRRFGAAGESKRSEADQRLRPLTGMMFWLRRHHRVGYTAAVGAVFWFLACQPTVLLTHAILNTLRVAEARVEEIQRLEEGEASKVSWLPLPAPRTNRLLVGRLDSAAERRVAELQRMEKLELGVPWRNDSVGLPTLVAGLLWLFGALGWWAICSRTFGWGAEVADREPARSRRSLRGEVGAHGDEAERREEEQVLRVVARCQLPSWRLSTATRRLLLAGKLDNQDGLCLTDGGRAALRAILEDRKASAAAGAEGAPAAGDASGAAAAMTAPERAIPSWTYVLVGAPVAIWLLGQPELLGNVVLWTTTIFSATKMAKRDA